MQNVSRTAPKKDLALEGLRGFACLGVFLAHFIFSFLPHTAQWMTKGVTIPQYYDFETILCLPFLSVFFNGSFAVSIFFVLSGYVITKRYFETGEISALRYGAAKRYPRLMIPALVSVLFAYEIWRAGLMFNQQAPAIGTAGWPMASYPPSSLPPDLRAAMGQGLLGAPLFGHVDLNSPLWTIQIELIGSVLLFAAYALFGRRRPVVTALLFMVLAVMVFPSSFYQVHFLTLFAGSLLHYIERDLRRIPVLPIILIIVGIISGAYDYSPWFDWVRLPMPEFATPLCNLAGSERLVFNSVGSVLLVSGVIGSTAADRLLSTRLPVYLGRISFSLYLLHWPIICSLSFGLMFYFKVRLGIDYLQALGVTAVATLAATVGASHLLELRVERPAISAANAFSKYLLDGGPRGRPFQRAPARHSEGLLDE
jgi:peptidoglycan/LPS O-acetylase OafA/YrhL